MRSGKKIAVLTAAILGVSTVSTSVWAAESYKEAEKASFAAWLADFTKQYGENLEQLKGTNSVSMDLTLSLDDTGKALAGMFIEPDISWFSDVSLTGQASLGGSTMAELLDLNVNGNKICSLEYYMDMETLDIYMKVPEISDSYIKMNYEETIESSVDELEEDETVSASISPEAMACLMKISSNISEMMPEANDLEQLLDKYGNLVIDSFTDGEAAVTDTLTAGGVSEDCSVFEGTITDADAIPLIKEILTEAKEDEIIKSLFAQWTEDTEEELYEEFQEEIDELLENAEKETADGIEDETEESYSLQSRIWVDDSGATVGREISIVDSYGSYITLSSKAPKDGDNCGYQLCLDSDGTSVSLEGSGVLDGTLLSGNYELSVSGQSMINVEVADYDTEAAKDGNICGNYTLSLLPGITDDEDTYAALSGFSVILTLKDEGNSGLIGLNLAASGVSIGTISMEAVTQDTELEIPDFAGFSDVYDFNNEEEMNAYTATISLDVVVQNLLDAGMPETFIQEMINAAGGETTEEVWDASEGTEVVVSDAA